MLPAVLSVYADCFWRQTSSCSSTGKREPQMDRPCAAKISSDKSGFCECEPGSRVSPVGCGHAPLTCRSRCPKSGISGGNSLHQRPIASEHTARRHKVRLDPRSDDGKPEAQKTTQRGDVTKRSQAGQLDEKMKRLKPKPKKRKPKPKKQGKGKGAGRLRLQDASRRRVLACGRLPNRLYNQRIQIVLGLGAALRDSNPHWTASRDSLGLIQGEKRDDGQQ